MSEKPETLFKKRVHKDLKAITKATCGGLWFVKTQQVCIRGTPDELLCVWGKFLAIELKREDAWPDPLQWHNLHAINEAGGLGICARPSNWDYILQAIVRLSQGFSLAPETQHVLQKTIGPRPTFKRRQLVAGGKLRGRAVRAK